MEFFLRALSLSLSTTTFSTTSSFATILAKQITEVHRTKTVPNENRCVQFEMKWNVIKMTRTRVAVTHQRPASSSFCSRLRFMCRRRTHKSNWQLCAITTRWLNCASDTLTYTHSPIRARQPHILLRLRHRWQSRIMHITHTTIWITRSPPPYALPGIREEEKMRNKIREFTTRTNFFGVLLPIFFCLPVGRSSMVSHFARSSLLAHNEFFPLESAAACAPSNHLDILFVAFSRRCCPRRQLNILAFGGELLWSDKTLLERNEAALDAGADCRSTIMYFAKTDK